PGAPAQFCRDAKSVDAGEHDIQDHEIVAPGIHGQPLERVLTVVDHVDVVLLRLEIETQAVRQMLFVLDDEDPAHCDVTIGSSTMNVLPWPGPSLSANTLPPCRATTERTMNRPSPVPLIRVAMAPGMR